ncbi:lariat debranching enzyme, C-terminal domain-containing protein [Daldinia caldariorum]|uniref:lariat debranching enzyme, C-terminal domain-containing protein n=1 Tax=Daldinia caldariorum TaxID=326644 RepID=UPI002007A582|nr:lariat debranching enzyme, C-terminal domain-containing protein [Daldinia caldariorum]KAI1471267.1 lariat debranching enzyme, C-terminal domain-containing protein [Daldinia caldariorum]
MSIIVSRCNPWRSATIPFLVSIGARAQHRFGPFLYTKLQLRYKSHSKTLKKQAMEDNLYEADGVRIAYEGCGHGTLDAIYASVATSSKQRGWDGVDLLIIGGDFQATRNAADLSVMAVPAKYRRLGDFPAYYSGKKKAPYLTIFIAGNHEASSYLWELYYGGWVAPKMYYMGAANVLRFGPLRIAAMSGIWKGYDYRKPHHERLPFNQDDIKSFYHVREFDVRKLLLLREQVDVGLSHDWPREIEKYGDYSKLWKMKPDFKQESADGTLGNPAATYVMDRLRPAYWFSAHLHCKYAAIKTYEPPKDEETPSDEPVTKQEEIVPATSEEATANPDEIDLDMEDDEDGHQLAEPTEPATAANSTQDTSTGAAGGVSDELRAQLPASFAGPAPSEPKVIPGQPVPPTITNTTTRFLALDKCIPGRKYVQLCSLAPVDPTHLTKFPPSKNKNRRYVLQYDPEWLAITRVFAPHLTIGDPEAQTPPDLGEAAYRPLIDKERAWVEENIVSADKLVVPNNFTHTAPPHRPGVDPETVNYQPNEYTNPQTAAFCELVGVPNLWDASPEERAARKEKGPAPEAPRVNPGGGGSKGGKRGGHRGGRGGGGRGGSRGGWHGRKN